MATAKINKRESAALITALTSGVVPRIGLRHIAVGRKREVDAFIQDLDNVENGSAAFRLISGQYGSGKSFMIQMIRNNAMERKFVVADADLSPERRMTGTKGQGVTTYRELMSHLSTTARPDGGALEAIMQKWINTIQSKVAKRNNLEPGSLAILSAVSAEIHLMLGEVSEMTFGLTFATVIEAYWRGMKMGIEEVKVNAIRWLRAEFQTRNEAKRALGVDYIINDENWYDFLKLFAVFVTKAGYSGLLIFLDEGVNLYKIANRVSRENNYEKILTIFNDTMQGRAQYIGFFLSGTPQFIFDEKRGLFTYEALRSRLANTAFNTSKYADYSSPIIQLNQLSPEELFLLMERLSEVHSAHYRYESQLGDNELSDFLELSYSRLGAEQLMTPREVTRGFLSVMDILRQNPEATFYDIINQDSFSIPSAESDPEQLTEDDQKESFSDFDV